MSEGKRAEDMTNEELVALWAMHFADVVEAGHIPIMLVSRSDCGPLFYKFGVSSPFEFTADAVKDVLKGMIEERDERVSLN